MKLIKIKSITFFIIGFTSINLFASLSNHPSSFKETVVRGGTKTIELHISNSISSPLGYSFTIPVGWVKGSPPNGSVGGNATLTVNLVFDATNLVEGKYNTAISLNDPHHGGLSIPIELTVSKTTDIKENKSVPTEFKLMQNYPNPFNPSTIISFSIPESQHVSLIVYDLLGKEVAVLVNEFRQPGSYNSQFSTSPTGRQVLNSQLSSGIYFYSLKTDRFTQTKKMLLTK
ncbi:hypothetical protein C0389_09040 [bacterium]|nr:hypothetical protein [bacterium]